MTRRMHVDANTVGLWRLDESAAGDVIDLSVNENDGSDLAATTAVSASDSVVPFTICRDFVRSSRGAIQIPNDAAYNLAAGGEITVEIWFRAESWDSGGTVLLNKYTDSDNGAWGIYYSATAGITAQLKSSGGTYEKIQNVYWFDLDEWYYVAFTFKIGGDLILYINGYEVGRTTPANVLADNTVDIYCGRYQSNANYDHDGQMAEFRISDRARQSWEILNIWKAVNDPASGLKP